MKKIIIILIAIIGLIILVGMFKFNILSNLNGYDVDGNKISVPNASYYQKLQADCDKQPLKDFKNCCLDSVKAMEAVGGTLVKGGKVIENDCPDAYVRMALRCPGSYAWCQTDPNNGIDERETPPVSENEQTINPSQNSEGIICTDEAKLCPDGTYVGRTGANCEFAECPGKPLKPDFVSTKDSPIQLPENVISEKDCATAGGEVWNTLGETSYVGELIGRIDGLKCPCACLVKAKKSEKLWVYINGDKKEFEGNFDEIKTFDDCKEAGFGVLKIKPEICQIGEPSFKLYKTFTNNSMEAGKTCEDYTYSTCPGSCVATCKSSSCSNQENGTLVCTSDCDGEGSCVKE